MRRLSFYLALSFVTFCVFLFSSSLSASAATCAISTDTVITQSYVTTNSCTAIDITENVSTTWLGTVNLGGGTVTVKTTKTMTMGESSQMVLGAADDLVVETSAAISHTASDPNGIQISARNVTVTGSIDANGKGCIGGTGGSAVSGYGPNGSGVCTSGAGGAGIGSLGGAGHGGSGSTGYFAGKAGGTYDSPSMPALLGSGGANETGSQAGGSGGGRVSLTVSGTLTVDGTVSANASDPFQNGGGGSGGAIYISANVLAGAGTIQANGSSGVNAGGAGGGGYVAIYYGSNSGFVLSRAQAIAGSPSAFALATRTQAYHHGTVFALDRRVDDGAGSAYFGSGIDLLAGWDFTRTSMLFKNVSMYAESNTSSITFAATDIAMDAVTGTFTGVINQMSFNASGGFQTTSTNLTWSNTSSVNITAGSWTTAGTSAWTNSFNNGTSTWTVGSALTLTNFTYTGPSNAGTFSALGGMLTIPSAIPISLVNSSLKTNLTALSLTGLTIDSTSTLNANAKGCPGGDTASGYSPHSTTEVCTQGINGAGRFSLGGGGYDGAGGDGYYAGKAGAAYGSSTNPVSLGSGGSGEASHGGNGGGIIRLVVNGTVTNDGSIVANGETVVGTNAGGSGGTVNIQAYVIEGSGTFTANGGNGGGYGGGGGGGRVALLYQSSAFTVSNATANYGLKDLTLSGNESNGANGTVYLLQTNVAPDVPSSLGPTSLVDGSTTSTVTPTFSFTLSDPDVGGTVQYQIQIDDSADFLSPLIDYTSALDAQGAHSFTVAQAAGSGSYAVGSEPVFRMVRIIGV